MTRGWTTAWIVFIGLVLCDAARAEPPAAEGTTVDPATLSYASPAIRQRLGLFERAARLAVPADAQFSPLTVERYGIQETWSDRAGSYGGFNMPMQDGVPLGYHRSVVRIVAHPFPLIAAVSFGVENLSADPARWSVEMDYMDGDKAQVMIFGWSVHLYRWDPAYLRTPRQSYDVDNHLLEDVRLPMRGYSVFNNSVTLDDTYGFESLARYARSAIGMRDAYVADADRLRAKVTAMLENHALRKSVSQGWGFQRRSFDAALTPAEERQVLARMNEVLDADQALVREKYEALFAAWRAAVPIDIAWPELASDPPGAHP